MKKIKLKGNNVEEKLNHVERILQQYSKRFNKKIVEKRLPFPISFYIKQPFDGNLFKYIFPLKGVIRDIVFVIEKFPLDDTEREVKFIDINLSIKSKSIEVKHNIKIKDKNYTLELSEKVEKGDRISLDISENNLIPQGIWIGFSFLPDLSTAKTEVKLIEEDSYGEEIINEDEEV